MEKFVVRLSERDTQYDVSVDQVYLPGFELDSTVFLEGGYTHAALGNLTRALAAGYRQVLLDAWWDKERQNWEICHPERLKDKDEASCGIDLNSLLSVLKDYIADTDTDVAVELLVLCLRLHEIEQAEKSHNHKAARAALWVEGRDVNAMEPVACISSEEEHRAVVSLNRSVVETLSDRIFTPADLAEARKAKSVTNSGTLRSSDNLDALWPNLEYVLRTAKKRVLIFADDLAVGHTRLLDGLLFPIYETPPYDPDFSSPQFRTYVNASFRTQLIDFEKDTPLQDIFASYAAARDRGFSPILASPISMEELLQLNQLKSWSWADNEPSIIHRNDRHNQLRNMSIVACGKQTENGWVAVDCNSKLYTLCRAKKNPYVWRLSEDKSDYFGADCFDDFEFSLPRTPLEARAAIKALGETSAWIDLNSLSMPNCWISGGTNAKCPYNIIESDRNGVRFIVAAAVCAFCLLCGIVLLEWDRACRPLKTRFQRKVVDFEGVPS